MSNILVTKLYKLKDNTGWPKKRDDNYYDSYKSMLDLMTSSANQYVTDLSDIVISSGEKQSIQHAFLDHFHEIYELWKQGHNILYCDVDVLFLRQYNVFDQFSNFAMFNYTEPRSTSDRFYNLQFPDFFNCAIRYYPSQMSSQVWEQGLFLINQGWNYARWDTEQVIYNHMMWSQPITLSDTLHPEMNWQAFRLPAEDNHKSNQSVSLQEANAVHFSGSRGVDRLSEMNRISSTYSEKK